METLTLLFSDKSINSYLNFDNENKNEEILKDSTDKTEYKDNKLFTENTKTLKIIIFQDAFEIVKVIGSAKKNINY